MSNIPSMQELAAYGIILPGVRHWITEDAKRARDAVPPLPANSGVPAEFTQYLDPRVIKILTQPDKARKLFPEVKVGDWTTSHFKFRVDEERGRVVPYSDGARGGSADVNVEYLTRQQHLFQTTITYGELESAVAGAAKLDLVSAKQQAAAKFISNAHNDYYLRGVPNVPDLWGFLNDPNLPAALPVPDGAAGDTTWASKTTTEIFDDVMLAFTALVDAAGGLVDNDTPMRLALSPNIYPHLGKATDFNVTVKSLISNTMQNLEFVTIPQMNAAQNSGVERATLYPIEIDGHPVAELAYGEKFRAWQVDHFGTIYEQKFSASTYGCVIYYPFLLRTITGM